MINTIQVWKEIKGQWQIIGNLQSIEDGFWIVKTLDDKIVYETKESSKLENPRSGWYYGVSGKRYIHIPIK